jgi:UDP-N-acetyl-2-amino-2-deoxyglucuronate dehydrogenase
LLGWGIIGCGRVFGYHARAVEAAPDVRLVAVCDIVEEKARAAAKAHSVPFCTTDYRELLARDDVDAVSVCLPHHLHCEATVAAARAGKHVLCEKPVAVDAAQADEMIEACDRAGVKLGVCYQNRYNESSQRLRRAVEAGAFGRIVSAQVRCENLKTQQYYDDGWHGRWATEGGGTLTTQAIHAIDLVLWLLGPVEWVAAGYATLCVEAEVEDNAVACLRFANGAFGTIASTNSSRSGWWQWIEILGTGGCAAALNNRIVRWHLPRLGEAEPGPVDLKELTTAADADRYGRGHVPLLADFVRSIREGKPFWLDAREGLKVSRLLWAIYESGRSGKAEPLTV